MTAPITRHIEAIGHTARALEELGRKIGYYSRDCDLLDAAVKRGRSGVVIIFDEDGEPEEVHCIGAQKAEAHIEKGREPESWTLNYSPLDESELARRIAIGKAQGTPKEKIDPMNLAKPVTKHSTKDEARIAKLSADYKASRQAGMDRTAEIAQRMKAEAAKLWAKKL
jgi:hypothetical protein